MPRSAYIPLAFVFSLFLVLLVTKPLYEDSEEKAIPDFSQTLENKIRRLQQASERDASSLFEPLDHVLLTTADRADVDISIISTNRQLSEVQVISTDSEVIAE